MGNVTTTTVSGTVVEPARRFRLVVDALKDRIHVAIHIGNVREPVYVPVGLVRVFDLDIDTNVWR